jgi:hypothetical protein
MECLTDGIDEFGGIGNAVGGFCNRLADCRDIHALKSILAEKRGDVLSGYCNERNGIDLGGIDTGDKIRRSGS